MFRGSWSVDIAELRESVFRCLDECYKDFKYFRRDILEKSLNDINEKTDLSFSFSIEKKNRRADKVCFEILRDNSPFLYTEKNQIGDETDNLESEDEDISLLSQACNNEFSFIENKQRFISQIMTSKSPVRSCEDVDEATLSYAEVKALCAVNPLIKEKMDLDIDVAKLKVLKSSYNSQHYSLEDKIIKEYPRQISVLEKRIEAYGKDLEHMRTVKDPDEGISMMVIAGKPYTDKEAAGEALASALKVVKSTTDKYNIGSFKGFDMYLSYNSFSRQFTLDLKREGTHSVVLGDSNAGNITRIENALNSIDKRIEGSKEQLKTVREQREEVKAELAKPFAREKELADKLTRLAQLNAELNIDGAGKSDISADEKPSVLGEISNLKKQAKEKDEGIGKKPERDGTDKKDSRQAI